MVLAQKGRVQEGVGRARVNQSRNGDRRLAGDEDMNQQGKVTWGGVGKGDGKREGAAQPRLYWLGRSFFGREEVSKVVLGDWVMGGGGTGVQGPGNGPWKGG